MLGGLLILLGQLEPIWVVITVVVGIIIGFLSKDIEFERKTLYLLAFMYLPFLIARTVAYILGGFIAISGTGYIGAIFFAIYLIAFIIGRRL